MRRSRASVRGFRATVLLDLLTLSASKTPFIVNHFFKDFSTLPFNMMPIEVCSVEM